VIYALQSLSVVCQCSPCYAVYVHDYYRSQTSRLQPLSRVARKGPSSELVSLDLFRAAAAVQSNLAICKLFASVVMISTLLRPQ
jgi:hypothetical protein